jgi:hypothetical protein
MTSGPKADAAMMEIAVVMNRPAYYAPKEAVAANSAHAGEATLKHH